jgi:hypothetical protein
MGAANAGQSMRDLTDIQNTEVGRKLDVRNRNLGLVNQSQGANINLANQYDDIEARRRGAAQGFTRQAMTDIGALSKDMATEGYLRSRDDKATAMDLKRLGLASGKGTKFDNGLFSADEDYWKKEKGTQGIKVPKYKKGTRYKTC